MNGMRLALRALRRRPGFAALVILTVGLGVGAAAAIFTVVDAVLLAPLPYHAADQLVMIWSRWSNFDQTWLSAAEYLDYRKQHQVFEDVAAWADFDDVAVTGGDGSAESVHGVAATANLLSVLGVSTIRGRMFTAAEDIPNGPGVVVVGYDLWRRRWGGDPGLIGKSIQLNGTSYTVVGILPKDFRLPLEFQSRRSVQLIGALQLDPASASRGNHGLFGVARLAPGVRPTAATAALARLTAGWTDAGLYPRAMRFSAFARSVPDQVTGPVRSALIVLAVAVGLLLILMCLNVSNLLLVRAGVRVREVAVRAALGAGRREMLKLALAESAVLGVMGSVLGCGLAWAAVRMLVARAPTAVPRLAELGVDWRVVLFAVALAGTMALVFALVPFWRIRNLDLSQALREGRDPGGGAGGRRGRFALVASETAFAALLLVGAGLTIRSFVNLSRIDPGFEATHVLTLHLSLPDARYPSNTSVLNFFDDVEREVRRLPGVRSAAFVRRLPLATEMGDAGFRISGRPVPAGEQGRQADFQNVSPGYFAVMGIPVLRGRAFDAHDDSAGDQVIAINRELAKEYFPGEDPLGQMVQVGSQTSPLRRIVAVVGDIHHNGLLGPLKRGFYVPMRQWPNSYGTATHAMSLVIRTDGDPRSLAGPVERIVHARDPDLPVTDVRPMAAVLASATSEQRFTMGILALFAALALTLAAVGIYGVISYTVSQRTREIGIRLALGSATGDVRMLVLRQGMRPIYAGVGAGLLSAILLARFLRALLYGVAPLDGVTFGLAAVVLLGVGAAAVFAPAVRASRVAPLDALREG